MRRRSLSAAEAWPEWVISPCQHIWGLLPAAAPAPCICPHQSVHLWVSGIYLSCQILSQNNCTVLLMGQVQKPTHTLIHIGHFTTLKRCSHPSQTHALTVSLNILSRLLHKRHHCNKVNTCNNHYTPKQKEKKLTTSLSVWGRVVSWTHKREDPQGKL